jgi:hypothetical protein
MSLPRILGVNAQERSHKYRPNTQNDHASRTMVKTAKDIIRGPSIGGRDPSSRYARSVYASPKILPTGAYPAPKFCAKSQISCAPFHRQVQHPRHYWTIKPPNKQKMTPKQTPPSPSPPRRCDEAPLLDLEPVEVGDAVCVAPAVGVAVAAAPGEESEPEVDAVCPLAAAAVCIAPINEANPSSPLPSAVDPATINCPLELTLYTVPSIV